MNKCIAKLRAFDVTLAPFEWLWIFVVLVDESLNGFPQVLLAAKGGSAQGLAGKQAEPHFDEKWASLPRSA